MGRNHTPKPLYGAKKWDKALLCCTVVLCDETGKKCDQEFLVAYPDGSRKCAAHFKASPTGQIETPVQVKTRADTRRVLQLLFPTLDR